MCKLQKRHIRQRKFDDLKFKMTSKERHKQLDDMLDMFRPDHLKKNVKLEIRK